MVPERKLGTDYDTAWARRYPVRLARAIVLDDFSRPVLRVAMSPRVIGLEHLDPMDGPMILAANHASHLDTALLLSILPSWLRHRTIVAAAADYFFDRQWKAAMWSFGLGAIPMERSKVNRRSADLAAELVNEGWSLIIFPEGGRTARRLGPRVQRRRLLSGQALRRAGYPGAHPRHEGCARQEQLALSTRLDRDTPRRRTAARGGRGRPQVRGPHRACRGSPCR